MTVKRAPRTDDSLVDALTTGAPPRVDSAASRVTPPPATGTFARGAADTLMAALCTRCGKPLTEQAKFCLHCGAMIEVAVDGEVDPLVGKIVQGRYRVLKVLGEGGMGKVYLAEQKMGAATRKVAIKTLLPELSGDPQLVARFHRESETVIELSHPNTIQFYDFGDLENGSLFIVMEYIEGESLANVLMRGPVDVARADRLIVQICGSLQEAHQRGVVHRDLKPDNILLTQRGGQQDFVKVLDFGIAKRSEAEDTSKAKLTKQGMVLGTPPYMSPEQFSGLALDARSDIYSLGIIAYELLTGKLPFEANTPWEWATKHLTAAPTPIEAHIVATTIPPNKRAAILRALAKNRDERQASVQQFMQEFTGYMDPQSAWTMATSGGIASAPQPPPSVSPVGGLATTPQAGVGPQAPSTGPFAVSAQATPSSGVAQYAASAAGQGVFASPGGGSPAALSSAGAYGPYAGGPTPYTPGADAPVVPTRGGSGKVVAIVGVLAFLLVGGVGAAYLALSGGDDTPPPADPTTTTATSTPSTTSVPPANVAPGTTTLVRLDPLPSTKPDAGAAGTGIALVPTEDLPVGPDPALAVDTADDPGAADEPDEPVEPAEPGRPQPDGPSAADVERARAAAQAAERALASNDLDGAIRYLASAPRSARRHALVTGARRNLERKGANKIGILLQSGRCADAQALYRQLASAGAEGASRGQFSPDWCRRP